MCPPAEEMDDSRIKESQAAPAPASTAPSNTALLVGFCAIVSVMSLIAAIVFGLKASEGGGSSSNNMNAAKSIEVIQADAPTFIVKTGDMSLEVEKPPAGDNICAGKKPELANKACYDQLNQVMTDVGPQSGANVTKGYKGNMEVTHQPLKTPYFKNNMCPVNVHWHLGTEHYSAGEYDEFGTFPEVLDNLDRRRTAELARPGYHCKHYNTNEPKFNTPYVWKHCVGMIVGQTYEVHWPHSAAGACGTPNQYQTPFYDGVFCRGIKSEASPEGVIDLATTFSQIGVQAQVFTIVNDEEYYYPDLMRGMIVDGEMGQDMHYYTGSTTGTSRNNANCSSYTPITWQVDRKCHMISASSFDKMCAEMKSQRDDMSGDLYAHGSRELVDDDLVANNGQRKKKRNLSA